jgi:hypothetical protein
MVKIINDAPIEFPITPRKNQTVEVFSWKDGWIPEKDPCGGVVVVGDSAKKMVSATNFPSEAWRLWRRMSDIVSRCQSKRTKDARLRTE